MGLEVLGQGAHLLISSLFADSGVTSPFPGYVLFPGSTSWKPKGRELGSPFKPHKCFCGFEGCFILSPCISDLSFLGAVPFVFLPRCAVPPKPLPSFDKEPCHPPPVFLNGQALFLFPRFFPIVFVPLRVRFCFFTPPLPFPPCIFRSIR